MQTPRPLDARETAAWHAFLQAQATVLRRLEADLVAEHDLSLGAYEVLAHLSESPERRARMNDLSRHCHLTASGVTRLVDKLERQGLVRRERCTADARVVHAALTDAGLATLERAYPTHLRGVREHLLDHLAAGDLDRLTAALEHLSD